MSTICKKEIRAYLTSMSGYVFIAFMLLVTGIYFTAYHMNMAYPIFGYTLSAVNFIFLIVTPILTMRALAEEQRQKTDQLLLTSPLSVTYNASEDKVEVKLSLISNDDYDDKVKVMLAWIIRWI